MDDTKHHIKVNGTAHLVLIDTVLWECTLSHAIYLYLFGSIHKPSTTQSTNPYINQIKPILTEDHINRCLEFNYTKLMYTCDNEHIISLNSNDNADTTQSNPSDDTSNKDVQEHSLVVNLSSFHLNDHAIAILSEGMNFA